MSVKTALALLEDAHAGRIGGLAPMADFDDLDLVDMVSLWRTFTSLGVTLRMLQGQFAEGIAAQLGEKGAIRVGDFVVRMARRSKLRCTDPDAFATFLAASPELIPAAVNLDYVRTSKLPGAAIDTFFQREWNERAELSDIPLDRAPAWTQRLAEGEVSQ